MEERKDTGREERFPGEVVEVYRQPDRREVVEVYTCPLPASARRARQAQPQAAPGNKKKKRTGLWIFLACLALLVLLAVLAVLLPRWLGHEPPGAPFEEPWMEQTGDGEITISAWPTGQGAELVVERSHGGVVTPQDIYRQVNPAVVLVMAQVDDGVSMGSGVIFREDGYILTNYHVVEGGSECVVMLDTGYQCPAFYVAGDADHDVAVLKVEETGLNAAVFGDSDTLVVGDSVYAIGNPLNYELLGTMTDGIISAVDREVEVDGRYMTLLQTNAALNHGNSGGPLINQYGQVVGINVIKMDSEYSNIEGLGFAIPSAVLDRVVNDLLATGQAQPEPLLGLSVIRTAEQLEEDLWGLEVDSVTAGGAADRAGVQKGDYVVSAAGQELFTSKDLLRVRRQFYVGDRMDMTLWRNGELVEVTLNLRESVND